MGAHFLDISQQWHSRAADLTRWTADRLLNRADQWLQYLPPRKRTPGKPDADAAPTTGQLTQKLVSQHYAATKTGQLIAVAAHDGGQPPATRFLAIQLIRTGEDDPVRPGQNFQVALDWNERLEAMGFDPILEDADGAGTYRLLLLFDNPADAAQVAGFGRTIAADYANQQLHTPPRLIPHPTDTDEHGRLEHLRLPGLHPHHQHHSTVWSGDHWLEGDEAIDALLSARATPATFIRKPRPKLTRRVRVTQQPTARGVTLPLSAPASAPESTPKPSEPRTPRLRPTPASEESSLKSGIPPHVPIDDMDSIAASIAAISGRTGLRESEVLRRVFTWLAKQDEAVQAIVLDPIPPAVRPAMDTKARLTGN